ncbi:MAG: hypothetical protein JWQ99_1460 [Blastococcus sp.]|nr:hypothetical protein [Blastococcus sp.]
MSSWRCLGCGGDNPDGFRFCGHCGTPSGGDGSPTAPGPPAAPREPEVAARDIEVTRLLRSFVDSQVVDRLVEAGGRLAEERRLVTALFADLSGFTTLAGRLDPEQLLEVIDPVIAGLTEIVGRHGGYVEKFAGDALLALFGAPVAHEDDAERALRVALEMHAELPRLAAGLADDLTLHIGVNTGHAVARVIGHDVKLDYAVLGDAVILAQRLESLAPPGQTYVGEATVRCVRGRFDLDPRGPQDVKGRAEPVPAWRLLGERAEAARDLPRLVGRDAEVGVLDQALRDGAHGLALVVVAGEPGSGKSRLLEEARLRAQAAGREWASAACSSSGTATPYAPWAELLRSVAGAGPSSSSDEVFRRLGELEAARGTPEASPFLAVLLGAAHPDTAAPDAERVADLEPEARRRETHRAVVDLVRGLALHRPLVLALEDVHWADPSTLALLREVLCAAPDLPLLVCLTTRSGPDIEREVGADAALRRHTVDLDRAPAPAVREVLDAVFAPDPPEALVAFLATRTAGNPFFVLESVSALADQGLVTVGDDGWRLEPGWDSDELPPTIEGVLAARMDRLPGRTVGVLQAAAVIGRTVPRPLLGAVLAESGLAASEIGAALADLHRLRFVRAVDEDVADGVLAFQHALLQDAAYSRLLRRHRRDLHARVAAAAARLYGDDDKGADVLARHLYLAEAGAPAVVALRRAGSRARALFANEEATGHLTRAVEVARACAPDVLPELLRELGAVQDLTGHYDGAATAYREALDTVPGDVVARRGLAGALRKRGELDAALHLLDEGLALADGDAERTAALQLELGRTHLVAGRLAEAERELRSGLTVAPPGSPTAAPLHLQLARALEDTGRLPEALEHGRSAQRLLEAGGDVPGLATAARVVGGVLGLLGRLDDAARLLREGLRLAERCGGVEEIGGTLLNLGMLELRRGALADAIGCDERAVAEFRRVGHASGLAAGLANLAEKLMLDDRLADADDRADEALRLATTLDDPLTVADALLVQAGVRLRREDPDGARDCAERAAGLFAEAGAEESAESAQELAEEARARAATRAG